MFVGGSHNTGSREPKEYWCAACGSKLQKRILASGYSKFTGRKTYRRLIECPNARPSTKTHTHYEDMELPHTYSALGLAYFTAVLVDELEAQKWLETTLEEDDDNIPF